MWGVARKLTVRQRLVAIVGVAIVPSAAAVLYFIGSFHAEREREVREQALRTSEIAALEMERIITGAQGILETLAFAPSVRFLGEDCNDYLEEIDARLPHLLGFAVADADGRVRCSAGMTFGPEGVAGAPWFDAALGEREFVVGEFSGPRADEPSYLPIAMRTDGEGPVRVVVTGLDLAWLGARLRERNLARGSALAVADRNGMIIAREPDPERFVGKEIAPAFAPLVHAAQPGTIELAGPEGTRRIVGYQPVAATATELYVGAGFSTETAFAQVYASTWRSLGLAVAGAAASCLVAWLLGERLFAKPIRRILATIASWRSGDDTARTGIRADASELAALAAAIDEYMDNLVAVRAEREAADERRTLLLREMNHRIKNVLAAVQAIANQTFKGRATTDSLRTFGSRLSAMAAAHDLLVSKNWESADLTQTLRAALDPFGLDRHHRFSLEGPPLRITAKAALALSMALHELCTNAAKYGALSAPGGRVAIRWWLGPGEGGRRFHLTWTESGGPPVAPPKRHGFGTRLIQSALASELAATAELQFAEPGVRFVLDAAATLVVADEPARAAGTAA
jgi:two-component sensor histidine kinase